MRTVMRTISRIALPFVSFLVMFFPGAETGLGTSPVDHFGSPCGVCAHPGGGETRVLFRSDGNAVYAMDASSNRPAWSEDGLLFRERYAPGYPNEEEPSDVGVPEFVETPMLSRHGRLYVLLDKYPRKPEQGNVLIALDVPSQGKLVWRLDAARPVRRHDGRFRQIEKLEGDTLHVLADGERTILIDVATGTILDSSLVDASCSESVHFLYSEP